MKIKAKETDYWDGMQNGEALIHPCTLEVNHWVMATSGGKIKVEGRDALSLLESTAAVPNGIFYLVCAKRILRGCAFEAFRQGRPELAPTCYWASDTREYRETICDPIDLLLGGVKTDVSEPKVLELLGIPAMPAGPAERAAWTFSLCKKMGLAG